MSEKKESVAFKAARVCKCLDMYVLGWAFLLSAYMMIEHYGVNLYAVGIIGMILLAFTVDRFEEKRIWGKPVYRKDAIGRSISRIFVTLFWLLLISLQNYQLNGEQKTASFITIELILRLAVLSAVFDLVGSVISHKFLNEHVNEGNEISTEATE